jgi:hypothetical protein
MACFAPFAASCRSFAGRSALATLACGSCRPFRFGTALPAAFGPFRARLGVLIALYARFGLELRPVAGPAPGPEESRPALLRCKAPLTQLAVPTGSRWSSYPAPTSSARDQIRGKTFGRIRASTSLRSTLVAHICSGDPLAALCVVVPDRPLWGVARQGAVMRRRRFA